MTEQQMQQVAEPKMPFEMPATIAGRLKYGAYQFLREAEVVALSPDSQGEHFALFKPNGKSSKHPKGLSELVKVIFAAAGGLKSLWIFNGPVPEEKVGNLAEQVFPGSMHLPSCNHAAWRHVAPITGVMHAVLWIGKGKTLTLSPETLGLSGPIRSMQGIFLSNGTLVLHIVCGSSLYRTLITPGDVSSGRVPAPKEIKDGVNCILTIPGLANFQEFIGKDDGLYANGQRMTETRGMAIKYISAATEIRRVLIRNGIGETWGFQVKDGCIIPPFVRVDKRRKSQLHFAGATYQPDENGEHVPAMMLSRIVCGKKTNYWTHMRTLVKLPGELLVPAEIALTIM